MENDRESVMKKIKTEFKQCILFSKTCNKDCVKNVFKFTKIVFTLWKCQGMSISLFQHCHHCLKDKKSPTNLNDNNVLCSGYL